MQTLFVKQKPSKAAGRFNVGECYEFADDAEAEKLMAAEPQAFELVKDPARFSAPILETMVTLPPLGKVK